MSLSEKAKEKKKKENEKENYTAVFLKLWGSETRKFQICFIRVSLLPEEIAYCILDFFDTTNNPFVVKIFYVTSPSSFDVFCVCCVIKCILLTTGPKWRLDMCVADLFIKNLRNTAVWYRRDLKYSNAMYN